VSETSRSGFARLTASEIFIMAWRAGALRLIPRRAGHSRGPASPADAKTGIQLGGSGGAFKQSRFADW
jgi:hypothetical protein